MSLTARAGLARKGGASLAGVALAFFLVVGTTGSGAAQPQSAIAQAPNVQRGVVIARTYCARCHSIDRVSRSPLQDAPPFRDLHKTYPVEQLEEPLAEGLVTGHPSMPEFRFDPGQINDFIAFLKTLE